ncbi:hypothetical protein [Shewanella sp. GD03713]|uniref:hypothetical protein n=1 Tax=Shewanella sp. GD03713 TaxID=2975372 RepID=UPI00244AC2C1|nr:hypothetical protein [Shewanella sp. GD03713]MDH1472136.1 hypothetical protein [Shewanella sp. GD03713]
MPRKEFYLHCESCNAEFKTSSQKVKTCQKCRKLATQKTRLANFFRSSFGKWLVTRISQSGTIKVLGNDFNVDELTKLYQLWKLRRKYGQLSYDADTNTWSSKIELQIGHIFPLKGGDFRVGELTPRNLVIIPSDLNNRLKNKVFNSGFYVVSNASLDVRQTKSKLIKAFKPVLVDFQNQHNLKGESSVPNHSFSVTNEEFTLLDIARLEARRLGVVFGTQDDANKVYERIFKAGVKLSPLVDKRPPAILPPDECKEIRLWDFLDRTKASDVDTTTYATLSSIHVFVGLDGAINVEQVESEFDYITVEGYNFNAQIIKTLYFCQTLEIALESCFSDANLAAKIYTTIDDCVHSFYPIELRESIDNPFKKPIQLKKVRKLTEDWTDFDVWTGLPKMVPK